MKDRGVRIRRFVSDVPIHIYQRPLGCGVIFYSHLDHLTFYTVISVISRKYTVTVYALCDMWNHYHMTCSAINSRIFSLFQCRCESQYVKSFNSFYKRTGPLFDRRFGSSPKKTDKDFRTNLAYICNNPVEKKICSKAELYRWNYLAYSASNNPFSGKVIVRSASRKLQTSMSAVDTMRKNEYPLYHHVLYSLFHGLDKRESEQLIDYIISSYSFIRYDLSIRKYGSFSQLCAFLNSVTGAEYEINEEWNPYSDVPYELLRDAFMSKYGTRFPEKIFNYTPTQKQQLLKQLRSNPDLTPMHIERFLHIEESK